MNVGQIFQRYFNDWQKFALVGLGALLVQVAAGFITAVLGVVMVGPVIFSLISMDFMGFDPSFGRIGAMVGAMGGFFIVAMVVGVVAMGMANGGMVGAVAAYRRGEDAGLGTFWSCAVRYFGKMILLGIIYGLILLVSALVNIIPVLGQLVFLLWWPTASIVLLIYPAYLIVNDDYSVGSAVGQGFQILKSQFGPSVLGGLIMLLFIAAFGLIALVPVVGSLVVAIFGQPLLLYFFIERFEHEVRPRLAA